MCDPYMYKGGQPDRTHTSKELHERYAHLENGEVCNEAAVSIAGRIVARRAFGKLVFMTVRDDSGTIQVRFSDDFPSIASQISCVNQTRIIRNLIRLLLGLYFRDNSIFFV